MSYGNLWGKTALYRLFDTDGTLLYIGISHDPARRWRQHAKVKGWWPLVARQSVTWLDERIKATAAEAEAIRTERPRFNVTHRPVGQIHTQARAEGVETERLSMTAFRPNFARVASRAHAARHELGELPITYVESRGEKTLALVPPWLAQWAERHAAEVLASLRDEATKA